MAAVARSLGSADSRGSRDTQEASLRVPCPLCGGLLHPVAGRCKHCKQDLTSHRQRFSDGSGGPLPRLATGTGPMGGSGVLHGPRAAATIGLGSPAYAVDAAPAPASRGWLRNWPLLVILLAVIGMIVALILLVLPQRHSSVRGGAKPLSNDNMQTDVLPGSGKSSALDPWNSSPPQPSRDRDPQPARPAPAPDPSAAPGADLDAVPDVVDPDDDSALGGVVGGQAGGSIGSDPSVDLGIVDPDEISPLDGAIGPGLAAEYTFESIMAAQACTRAAECEGSSGVPPRCTQLLEPQPRATPRPQRCRNVGMALRCMQAIEALPCDVPPTRATVLSIQFCAQQLGC